MKRIKGLVINYRKIVGVILFVLFYQDRREPISPHLLKEVKLCVSAPFSSAWLKLHVPALKHPQNFSYLPTFSMAKAFITTICIKLKVNLLNPSLKPLFHMNIGLEAQTTFKLDAQHIYLLRGLFKGDPILEKQSYFRGE